MRGVLFEPLTRQRQGEREKKTGGWGKNQEEEQSKVLTEVRLQVVE